jgi:hypothetical protein
MTVSHYFHALLHGQFYRLFIRTLTPALISSIKLMPSGCASPYYMLDTQFFFHRRPVPHNFHIFLILKKLFLHRSSHLIQNHSVTNFPMARRMWPNHSHSMAESSPGYLTMRTLHYCKYLTKYKESISVFPRKIWFLSVKFPAAPT